MNAYYNENDPFAAAWLRNLIGAGHIAPGHVDERSIVDVRPSDLLGYSQCHFFAGIGVWSHALRGAGWPDDRAVWTGSCPCQPFSGAGKRTGFADERHLWPAFFHLIAQCRPRVVLGEQVANKDGLAWLDLVHTDMETENYAFAALDLCAAGIGAPHIRQRLYWMANANEQLGRQGRPQPEGLADRGDAQPWSGPGGDGGAGFVAHARCQGSSKFGRGRIEPARPAEASAPGELANASHAGFQIGPLANDGSGALRLERPPASTNVVPRALADAADGQYGATGALRPRRTSSRGSGEECSLADTERDQQRQGGAAGGEGAAGDESGAQSGGCGDARALADAADRQFSQPLGGSQGRDGHGSDRQNIAAGPVNGLWRNADWLLCRDGKWRAVEPGTFPLADGAANRVGRLRGYGNAIVAPVAQAFIEAVMGVTNSGA